MLSIKKHKSRKSFEKHSEKCWIKLEVEKAYFGFLLKNDLKKQSEIFEGDEGLFKNDDLLFK